MRQGDKMRLGVGLPNTVPGAKGAELIDWAGRAERAGFDSLAATDRLVYRTYDPFAALAAASSTTERIRLRTTVALGPLRSSGLLAQTVASLDQLSGGRFELGIAVGSRANDFEAGEANFAVRGATLDRQLTYLRALWADSSDERPQAVGPELKTTGGPSILIGGKSPATWRRIAQFGEGWICGGGGVHDFLEATEKMKHAWQEEGRRGEPRRLKINFFSLGARGREHAEALILDYYAFSPIRDATLKSVTLTRDSVLQTVESYQEVGCEELIFIPCSSSPEQVDMLAEILFE